MFKRIILMILLANTYQCVNGQCQSLKYGIAPNWPQNWDQQDKDDWFVDVSSHGNGYLNSSLTWRNLSELADSGQLSAFRDSISLIKSDYGIQTYSFVFQNPATVVNPMPPLYCGSPLTDTAVSNTMFRFAKMFIDTMYPVLDYFILGEEADVYFKIHPEQMDSFVSLANKISNYIDNNYPSIKFGVALSFRYGIQIDQTLWNKIKGFADVMAITYWPTNGNHHVSESEIDSIDRDIEELLAVSGVTPIVIIKSGLPTHDSLESSEGLQAKFVRELFQHTASVSQIEAVGLNCLSNYDAETIMYYQDFYMDWSENMNWYLQSIGFSDSTGQPKTAYTVYIEMLDSVCANNSIQRLDINSHIIIFPNPVIDNITIQNTDQQAIGGYEIWNLQGQLLSKGYILKTRLTMDFSVYENGVYFIHFTDLSNQVVPFVKKSTS